MVSRGAIAPEQLEEVELIRAEAPYLRVGEALLGMHYVTLTDYMRYVKEFLESLRR